jgi:SAM-dependent methyltransferase
MPLATQTIAAGAPDPPAYPLHIRICDDCNLAQVSGVPPEPATTPPAFLSSSSAACVQQAARFAEAMRKRLRLNGDSLVIEVGSNDGYLLRHLQRAGIPVLGLDPDHRAAAAAMDQGIATETTCFTTSTAMEVALRHGRADLVVAANVLARAPDLFDFAAGFASILRPNGIVSLQVPHLLSLVQRLQFDAFRHDSRGYLSLRVLERMLRSVGLRVFDAMRVPDHGGSLQVLACHAVGPHPARPGLKSVRLAEACAELDRRDFYSGFSNRVAEARADVRAFLEARRDGGRRVAAYGAAARGITMLNACAITPDLIACVADPDPAKHGRTLPGSRIPIVALHTLIDDPPHDVLVLPWTNATEVAAPLQPLRHKGTQLWTAIPRLARV